MGETLAAANDRIVREFLAAWERRDTAAIEPIVGKDAIRAFEP